MAEECDVLPDAVLVQFEVCALQTADGTSCLLAHYLRVHHNQVRCHLEDGILGWGGIGRYQSAKCSKQTQVAH